MRAIVQRIFVNLILCEFFVKFVDFHDQRIFDAKLKKKKCQEGIFIEIAVNANRTTILAVKYVTFNHQFHSPSNMSLVIDCCNQNKIHVISQSNLMLRSMNCCAVFVTFMNVEFLDKIA